MVKEFECAPKRSFGCFEVPEGVATVALRVVCHRGPLRRLGPCEQGFDLSFCLLKSILIANFSSGTRVLEQGDGDKVGVSDGLRRL